MRVEVEVMRVRVYGYVGEDRVWIIKVEIALKLRWLELWLM